MKIKPCRLSKQLDSVTENPFVFCGYKVSHVIGQNTHSRNIFSVHGFLNLSVKPNLEPNIFNVIYLDQIVLLKNHNYVP